jgi:hypothetical protein
MIQFNEAINKALVEAVVAYGLAVEKTRKVSVDLMLKSLVREA